MNFDINKKKLISNYSGHKGRVGVVSWNGNIISSGSKDCNIITRDIRCKNNNGNIIVKFIGHSQEVCGLKWSFDGSQLASGGNDNNLMIWNLHSTKPIMCNNSHLAAVKAIAWSPHQHNILATGGGTADRTIRFWNTSTFQNILKYDTGSQVCNLVFSKTSNELISTHGFSLNQINVWKLPNLQKNIKSSELFGSLENSSYLCHRLHNRSRLRRGATDIAPPIIRLVFICPDCRHMDSHNYTAAIPTF